LFSTEDAVELLSIVMKQVVQTPGMIAGVKVSDEAQALVSVIASAVAAQGSELLTPEDWKAVAQAIAIEVARNPGRLISLGDSHQKQLAGSVLRVLLSTAAESFPGGKRTHASLLFGQTLREAAIMAIAAAAENSGKAAAHLDSLQTFVQVLNGTAEQERISAREWLWLFDSHVAGVLATGLQTSVTVASLLSELEQRDA
jgi:hypothetical protein